MNYIVFDMEWNQPFSLRTTLREPVYLTGEVVQLGALKLDEQMRIVDTLRFDIAPVYYTRMNPAVREVTRLTELDLRRGRPFPEAGEAFRRWCGEDFVLIMWGDGDVKVLRENYRLHGMDEKWLPEGVNLQEIFCAQVLLRKKQVKLASALAMVSRRSFPEHDALSDARATAEICRALDMRRGLEEYDGTMFLPADGCVEHAEYEDGYSGIDEALEDDYVVSFECPDCGELCWCGELMEARPSRLLALSQCECGKEYLVRLNFKNRPDYGELRAIRRVYPLTEELWEEYAEAAAICGVAV